MSLVNISVHTLTAGDMQLLQSSHNSSGLEMSHLRCNLKLKKGARHFLLGRNGCGKSTMLRAAASGKLDGWPHDLRMHLVDQDELVDLEHSPMDMVLGADPELFALNKEKAELEACTNPDDIEAVGLRLCEIYELEEEFNDGQRRARAGKILGGLGFDNASMHSPMKHLSGGWLMRSVLAAALFMEPDLLLLDEPTNHLDITAISWLQQHLAYEFKGTVLCVSHDRSFVNALADEIIVFTEDRSLEYFTGSLSDLYKHADKMARRCKNDDNARQKQIDQIERKKDKMEQQSEKMENGLSKMENGLSSNKENKRHGIYQGLGVTNIDKASARAKREMKKLDRLSLEAEGQKLCTFDPVSLQTIEGDDYSWAAALAPRFQGKDSALKFVFNEAVPLELPVDTPMLELSSVSFCYDNSEEHVLRNIDFSIFENCRISIVGKNGAGKSSFVKLLTGEIAPVSGEVRRNPNLRITFFGQHDAEMLQQRSVTPLQYLAECFPKVREHELCSQLVAFGVTEKMSRQSMAELSGGQRMRVAFARMCAEEPHLLVLDEPTNHLDIYAIEALSDALKDFQGGVLFVTHNAYLIEEVADDMVIVDGHGIRTQKASLVNKKRFDLDIT